MKNRLQLRYHFPDKLPTRNEAINYINNIFSIDANDGLTSLIAEPLVVFYNNDTTLNRRRSIESANVILAIGRGGDGTNVEKNKDYFIIDFAKNVEDIYKINEIIGDVNDDKSKSSIYGLITKNLESIENEIIRAKEVETRLFQSIEDAKNQLLSEINNNKKDISDEVIRATQAENEILEELNNTKFGLQEQISKNKVISSDKTIIVNTDSPSNTNISVNVDNESIKIDEQTGKLSVKQEAFIKYDGENAIQINDKENYTKEISLIINQDDKILSNEINGLKSTLSLEYIKDDENKPLLRLIGKNSEIISSINVSDFINDGMIESVELEDVQGKKYLVITWNTAAGKDVSRLEVSSLIDVYTAGNGIKLNNGEFSIKLKNEQSLLESDELGLYVNEDVLNNKIKSNTENLIDNKITERFNESKDYTNDSIDIINEKIEHYLADAKSYTDVSEENAKQYADDLKNKINNDITDLTNKDNILENSITSLNQEINIIESNITNLQQNKLDTIKISGNVISRNGTEINIPLGVGLKLDKNNSSINLDINEDFEATTEGISISNNFKNKITNDNNNTLESAKKYTDTKIEPLDAILNGYGTSEGKTATVKSDITSLQEQIDVIHTHDNKEVLDGITAEKVQAWDTAEANAKKHADDEIAKVVETLEGADDALDSRIQSIEGTLTEKETKWDDAVSKINTFLDENAVSNDVVDTLKELQEYIESDGSAANELVKRVAANEAILAGYGTEEGETTTVKDDITTVKDDITTINNALIEYKAKVGDIQTLNVTADEFKENRTFLITSGLYKINDGILFCDNNSWDVGGIKLTHIKDGKIKTCQNTNTPSKYEDIIIWSDWVDYYSILNEKIDDVEAILEGFGKEEGDVYETVMGVFRKQALVDAAQNTILEGYGVGEGETPTVKRDITILQGRVDALENTLIGTDEDTKDSDSIKGTKKYTDEKITAEAKLREDADSVLNGKIDGHIKDTVIHVTENDKNKWDGAVSKIDTFLADAELTENAVDTLKELQEYIESDGSAANELVSKIDNVEAILEGYGTEEGETATVKVDIDNLQEQIDNVNDVIGEWSDTVDALENTLIGTDEDTKDSDSIKGAKKYTDEKIQEVIENIGTLNGDINTTKNGVQLINNDDKCGLLFTKGDKQRLITFDGIIERLFNNETNEWENDWNGFVTWGNNLPTEPTTPEVSEQTLDIKNNGTVSEQTLDIKNNGTVENKILSINK